MIEAGINAGDIVVIQEQPTAENGDIVVALIEDEEATLKSFRRRGSSIALEAANPAYETRLYRDHQVRMQGKLVGLIRTYLRQARRQLPPRGPRRRGRRRGRPGSAPWTC